MTMFDFVAQELLKFDDGSFRYFGNPYQVRVDSYAELEKLILSNNGVNDCYLSISQFDPMPYIDYVPFDFDGKMAYSDACKLKAFFDEHNLGPYIFIFSGSGYHAHLKVVEHHYSSQVLANFQNSIIDNLQLTSADKAIVGDVRRLMRIVGTVNISHNTLCSCVAYKEDGHMLDLMLLTTPEYSAPNISAYYDTDLLTELHAYPCLKYWIRSIEPPHLIRVWYVTYLLTMQYSVDDIIEKLKSFHWADWSESYTRYQVTYIVQRNLKMPKCETIKKYGYCLGRTLCQNLLHR